MKAIVQHRYGGPEVLALEEVDPPTVPPGGVRVRVRAAALNALDWYFLGTMMLARLRRDLPRTPGVDFAGTVDAVAPDVSSVRVGDDVFGAGKGTLAEFVVTTPARLAAKPPALTFEQVASLPVAGLTALQGLRDHGHVGPGRKVLVHGASGGVGTFAIGVAKALGADVTAVCSTRHLAQARALGADTVIDYVREDFAESVRRYDVFFQVGGAPSWARIRRVLAPRATFVGVGGPRTNRWLGPLGYLAALWLGSRGASQRVTWFVAQVRSDDLSTLAGQVEAGALRPVLETFALSDAAEAFRRLGEGHADGKIVLTVP